MARRIDSGWARFILLAVGMLAAIVVAASTFNGRIVRTETRVDTMAEDIRIIKDDVKSLLLRGATDDERTDDSNASN